MTIVKGGHRPPDNFMPMGTCHVGMILECHERTNSNLCETQTPEKYISSSIRVSKHVHADITISAANISTTSEHDSNLRLNSIIKFVHIHYIFGIIPFRKERYGR